MLQSEVSPGDEGSLLLTKLKGGWILPIKWTASKTGVALFVFVEYVMLSLVSSTNHGSVRGYKTTVHYVQLLFLYILVWEKWYLLVLYFYFLIVFSFFLPGGLTGTKFGSRIAKTWCYIIATYRNHALKSKQLAIIVTTKLFVFRNGLRNPRSSLLWSWVCTNFMVRGPSSTFGARSFEFASFLESHVYIIIHIYYIYYRFW